MLAMVITRPLFLFRILLATLALVLAPIGATGAAAASLTTTASGTWAATSVTFNSSHDVGGGVTIDDVTAHVSYTGTFTGTSIVHGFLVFLPDGSAFFHDDDTFTGTVNGKSGTVTIEATGKASAAGDYRSTRIIVGGTGALAHLHGRLLLIGTVQDNGPAGTYTGQLFTTP